MKFKWKQLLQFTKNKKRWLVIGLPVFLLGCFLFSMTLTNVFTQTYDIEKFSDAKETIRSPITIENTKETDRKTREAVQAVEDRYTISSEVTQERVDYINELFDAVAKQEEEVELASETDDEEEPSTAPLTTDEKIQNLQQLLSPEVIEQLDEQVIENIIEATPNERSLARELLTTSLYDVLNEGVRTETVQEAVNNANQQFRYSSLNDDLKDALYVLSEFAIVENSFFDSEKTDEAQKQAINNVEPVMIQAGEVIVREDQSITTEIYDELALVGLLNEDRNIYPVIGLIILILLLCGIISYEVYVYSAKHGLDPHKMASILIISVLIIAVMKGISLYTTQVSQLFFIVPAAAGAMLLKILLDERLAIVLSVVYAILGSIIFNGDIPGALNIEAGLYLLFTQLAGIIFLVNVKDRTAIVKAGAGITVVNVLTVLLFLLFSFEKYTIPDLLLLSGYGVGAAFLSSVFTIGMLSFFETGLGILSDTKLLTLSSPTHPLLRKILTEAPGTYHHSVMVANLSEASCEAIGANGLLARVASYYHDLGKTVRPHYFIENQMGIKNPHDLIEPKQSADIIISHPYDGAKLLKEYKLPKEIIDIAEQHHGTSLLKFFYFKAKEKYKSVDEKDFRYPGPKPRSKEAAIISICDSVEAAVRSLKEPTTEKIEQIITSIINERLMDGQLSESSLTFRELESVHVAISETLNGIFHSRIQYPEQDVKEAN